MKTESEWVEILVRCGVRAATAVRWAPAFAAIIGPTTFNRGESELDDFLGQVLHESALLEHTEEALSYSTSRLCAVWPKRFPSIADAGPFAHNPEALANKVYGGRLGNVEPGDGYRFRGRGLLQVTGRDNYRVVGAALGIDLVEQPDLMSEPETALAASLAWWERNIPDDAIGNVERVTRRVNGGTVGLADRQHLTDEAREALT